MYKWTHSVETRVVQGPTVYRLCDLEPSFSVGHPETLGFQQKRREIEGERSSARGAGKELPTRRQTAARPALPRPGTNTHSAPLLCFPCRPRGIHAGQSPASVDNAHVTWQRVFAPLGRQSRGPRCARSADRRPGDVGLAVPSCLGRTRRIRART